jgi:hypothetical protein
MQISHKIDVEISDTLQYVKTIYKHGSDNMSFGRQESLGNRGAEYMEAIVRGRLVRHCAVVALLNQLDSLLGGSVIQGEGVHV